MQRKPHTKPGAAACPPVPYPAHTATVVCRGGTLSGSSPEKYQQLVRTTKRNTAYRTVEIIDRSLHSPSTPEGRTRILISVKTQITIVFNVSDQLNNSTCFYIV